MNLSPGRFFVRLTVMWIRIIWLGLILSVPGMAAERLFELDASLVGKIPPGFRSALFGEGSPAEWKVILDEVAPTLAPLTDKAPVVNRRPVLAQLSTDPTDERYPLLIFEDETYGDFTLSTRFKLVSGEVARMAGVIFRAQNETNFYVIRASGSGNTLRFYKVVNGERGPPLGPALPVTSGQWHELEVSCQANQIRCRFNGQEVFPPLNDSTFPRGKIGFWTKSDAVTYFADTKIVYRPLVPHAQTLVKNLLEKYPRLLDLKITTLNAQNEPRVIAAKHAEHIGQTGAAADQQTISEGKIFFGRGRGEVTVVMPLRDRNGDPMAAVRVVMQSFTGQTEQNAVVRAQPLVRELQRRVHTREELLD